MGAKDTKEKTPSNVWCRAFSIKGGFSFLLKRKKYFK